MNKTKLKGDKTKQAMGEHRGGGTRISTKNKRLSAVLGVLLCREGVQLHSPGCYGEKQRGFGVFVRHQRAQKGAGLAAARGRRERSNNSRRGSGLVT